MTLCIATRLPNQIRVVSDSRLSFGDPLQPADACVKISSVRATIYPWRESGKPDKPDFDQSIGIAVVGSHTTTAIIRELLRALLTSVQYPAGVQALSLTLVCDIARSVFEQISGSVCNSLADLGLSQFLLIGHCPLSAKPRAFLFNIDATHHPITAAYKEVLLSSAPLCLGTGAAAAEQLFLSNPTLSPFQVLKRVIDDAAVPSVGGVIQAGELSGTDFALRGVEDFFVDEPQKSIAIRLCVAGLPVYRVPLSGGWTDFPYRQSFLQPFKTEIAALIDQDYRPC